MEDKIEYWKGKKGTSKEGMCGTKNEETQIPDSEKATLEEYNIYKSKQINKINI